MKKEFARIACKVINQSLVLICTSKYYLEPEFSSAFADALARNPQLKRSTNWARRTPDACHTFATQHPITAA